MQRGPGRERAWHERHQRGLLGVMPTSHPAEAAAHAVGGVDLRGRHLPPEGPRPVEQNAVVGRMGVFGDGAGVHLTLHALEHGAHLPRRHAIHAGFRGPLIEHEVRRAQHDHPVHRGGSTHGIALHQRHRRIVGGPQRPVGIQLLGELGLPFVEIGARAIGARLQHDHLEAGFGQSRRRHRAASASADDNHIGGAMQVGAQGNGGNHPAWERVGGDDRGQRDRTTRHRLVGPTNPGQRAFPWHPR